MEKTGTPGIYKRGDTYTYVLSAGRDPVTGKRKQLTQGGFKTIKAAATARAKKLTELESGTHVEAHKTTLAEYLRYWLKQREGDLRPGSIRQYGVAIEKHLIPGLGHHPLNRLRPLHIQSWVTSLREQGLTNNTVRQYLATLQRALRQAVRWQLLATNPCEAVDRPQVPKPHPSALSLEETTRLLKACEGHPAGIGILLGVLGGLRRGEVLALRWQDVDLGEGTLSVRCQIQRTETGLRFVPTKTGDERTFRMPERLTKALRKHRGQQAEWRLQCHAYVDHGLIFAREDGGPFSGSYLYYAYRQLAEQLGLSVTHFHGLRHTASAHHLQAGTPYNVVASIMGHRDGVTTLRVYGAILKGSDTEAAARIDAALNAAEQAAG